MSITWLWLDVSYFLWETNTEMELGKQSLIEKLPMEENGEKQDCAEGAIRSDKICHSP